MKQSITNKIGILSLLFILSTSVAVGVVFYRGTNSLLIQRDIRSLSNELNLRGVRIQTLIDGLRNDVLFLSRTPPIQGIIRTQMAGGPDPVDGSTEKFWRMRLAIIFSEFLKAKTDYTQVRYIGIADGGREIVRVDRSEGHIVNTDQKKLQAKGSQPYFLKSIKARKNEVYLSEISLNREHGKVVEPFTPVLRASVPIYTLKGEVFGIVAINMGFGPHLQNIHQYAEHEHFHYFTNDRGDFLAHPDPSKTFGFDLGKRHTIQALYPELADSFAPGNDVRETQALSKTGDRPYVISFIKVPFDPLRPERFLGIGQATPYADVVAASASVLNRSILLTLGLIVAASILVLYFSRRITRPLSQITQATEDIAKGEFDVPLPLDSGDEIGVLARSFKTMVTKVQERGKELQDAHDNLEIRVKDRTVELKTAIDKLISEMAERRRAKEALRKSEVHLRAIVDNVEDGIIVIDENGIVETFNPAAEQIFGYSADEVLGENISRVMPEPYKSEHDGYIQKYLLTGESKIMGVSLREVVGKRKDGSTFPMEFAAREIFIEDDRKHVVMVRDLTERKRMENLSTRMGRILNNSFNEIYVFDATTLRFSQVNYGARENLGYTMEELTQLTPLDLKPSLNQQEFEKLIQPLRTGEKPMIVFEIVHKRKDGSLYPVEVRLQLMQEEYPPVFVAIIEDITQRKEAEDKLQMYANELERSNQALGSFAAIASHDLKEPLRKIILFGDRLKEKYGDVLDHTGKDYLSRMQKSTQRMQQFIDDLLELSKITTRGQSFERVDLNQVVREVMEDLETRISTTGGTVHVESLPTLNADPLQMRQLFQNLIGNALKFHKQEEPPQVQVNSRPTHNGTWQITVQDNGIGFDEKYLHKIFMPFERLNGRSEFEGSGMGMAICKRIVERHKGAITANSQPGKGATFTFTMPEKQNMGLTETA